MARKKAKKQQEVVGFLGVGFDNDDGHRRLTSGDNFLLVGGSDETHERMIDTAVFVNEELERQGKRVQDASLEELEQLFRDAQAKTK